MAASGKQDIDVSITTRELARMIKQAGIDFNELPDEEADHMLGDYSGAGTLFGATGGVMEAALRTAYDYITGGKLKNVEFENVRGLAGIKEGTIPIGPHNVKVAVAHGLSNVEIVLNKIREAKKNNEELPYHFIEVMACPGGCVGGGGQPYGVTDELVKNAQRVCIKTMKCIPYAILTKTRMLKRSTTNLSANRLVKSRKSSSTLPIRHGQNTGSSCCYYS